MTLLFNHKIIPYKSTIVVGLSGGPDSVCLLHILVTTSHIHKSTIIAAHLNHEWRNDAINDEAFCETLCNQLNITYTCSKISQLSHTFKSNGSPEELARKYRYAFFNDIANQYQANAIALAHHTDDQQENFFIRLIRGTTLSGLVGMKEQNEIFIRPLLKSNKSHIYEYLKKNNLSYALDSTNNNNKYLRNHIRNKVIPSLQESDHRFNNNFSRLINNLSETEQFINETTIKFYNECTIIVKNNNNITAIDTNIFKKIHQLIQKKIILHWIIQHKIPCTISHGLIQEIIRFIFNTNNNTHTIYPNWIIIKKNNILIINNNHINN